MRSFLGCAHAGALETNKESVAVGFCFNKEKRKNWKIDSESQQQGV